ncbi:MAG: NAD(P)/FAD-dependent oxidoreductase, partial [Proteobacteria bacterium]|nr:NAD(P)/FAD-dependent oxidoreductase [Pseudomonadota bacterium]
ACLGEAVDPAYAPLVLEDLGFSSGDTRWTTPPDAPTLARHHVVIVGAGLSGLGLGMQLAKLGIPFTVLERNPEAGGTWFENRYPGAGVDTPNLFYSWSAHRNPHWTRYFSLRDEILAYIRDTASGAGLLPHIRFNAELTRADWDAKETCWQIEVTDRRDAKVEHLQARFLVSAIGHISEPNETRFPGMERFEGPLFHSARWPDGLELAGKRVAIIGTGATAMQLAPAIVERVAHLTVYQRTPQWARPTPEYRREVSPGAQWLFEHLPFYAQWYRFTLFWRYGDGLLQFLKKDPHWPHPQRSLNKVNDRHREQMTAHIEAVLAGRPDLLAKSVPHYPPYAKRILLDNGWYDMLLRENVGLVTDPIERMVHTGVVTRDGTQRAHEVIILATGFSIAKLSARLDLRGVGGRTLAAAWADDNPSAYLGITVPDFPNLFLLYGPNTNLGHGGSAIFHAECQVRYIARTLVAMIEGKVAAIDVRPEVHRDWVARVDAEHAQLIWTHPGVSNWYRNRHGRVVSTSPFRLVDYWRMTHEADLENYRRVG